MSQLNSVRVPATVIFTALLLIILVSSSHTTYRLSSPAERAPSAGAYALAGCESRPLDLVPMAEPRLAIAPVAEPRSGTGGREKVPEH